MKTTKKEKTFDAVKMMREIRAKISEETKNMTFEQLKKYIKIKLDQKNVKLVGEKQKSIILGLMVKTADDTFNLYK